MNYSNSQLQSFKLCPLSYYLRYEVGLKKIEDEGTEHHVNYGSAIHEGLKRIYLGESLEASLKAFKDAYPTQLDSNDNAKTQANGVTLLTAYVKRWSEEDKKWRVVSVEEREGFDYGQVDAFSVKPDLIMENIAFGGIYGFDHKTVGGKNATLSYEFWGRFDPNSQISKYISFIKSKYGDCSGFYINAIGLGFRQRMYKGEPAGFWYRFERQMFNRNSSQLQVEQEDTKYWIERIEQSRATGQFGMNTESCRWCTYKPICSAGWRWPQDQELIEIQYARIEGKPKENSTCQTEAQLPSNPQTSAFSS